MLRNGEKNAQDIEIESVARSWLKGIFLAESELKESVAIDKNKNGKGEYGTFNDLLVYKQITQIVRETLTSDVEMRGVGYTYKITLSNDPIQNENGFRCTAIPLDSSKHPILIVDETGTVKAQTP